LDSPLTHTIVGLHALAILIDPPLLPRNKKKKNGLVKE